MVVYESSDVNVMVLNMVTVWSTSDVRVTVAKSVDIIFV